MLQAPLDLCSESYFGQEIEHLLSLEMGFFPSGEYRLPARRDAVSAAGRRSLVEILQRWRDRRVVVFVHGFLRDDFTLA